MARKESKAWQTLVKFTHGDFKVRFYIEPRNVFFGIFWDFRGGDFNLWISLMPIYTIQIAIDLKEPKCACGYKHGDTSPPWCLELRTLKIHNKVLKDFWEQPLILRKAMQDAGIPEKKTK